MTPFERADRAKQIIEDPVFRQAMAEIRERIVSKMEQSAMSDVDTHHDAALTLMCLNNLRLQLERYVQELAMQKYKDDEKTFLSQVRQTFRI